MWIDGPNTEGNPMVENVVFSLPYFVFSAGDALPTYFCLDNSWFRFKIQIRGDFLLESILDCPSVGEMLLLVFSQNTWLASNPHKKYDDMTYCNLPNILDCELLRAEMAPIYLCMSGIFHNIWYKIRDQ